jgi:CubicO group peptidase (beta-lactamase class C family)
MMLVAGVPGVSVATVESGVVATQGHGVTRATDGTPVNADTIFEAASLGKPVFAWLALQLAAEGMLDLDRPVREYLPLPATDARSAGITARHILSHSSGWRNWRNTTAQPLVADFEPGTRFSYSGEGFYFLGRVLEKVTGKGILRLTRERIFEPLGMRRSSYLWSPELDANRAEPHTARGVVGSSFGARVGKALRDVAASPGTSLESWTHEDAERLIPVAEREFPALPNFLLPNVAGSLLTTANDYARFMVHLLAGGPTLATMSAPQTPINTALLWGLGIGLQRTGSGTQLWHWGDTSGFKNFLLLDPAAKSGIVVFTNGQNGRAIYERVVRAERGDQPAFLWI